MGKLNNRVKVLSCVLIGLFISSFALFSIVIQSDGTEPRGICKKLVEVNEGWILFNSSGNSERHFQCELDIPLTVFYILPPAIILMIIGFMGLKFVEILFFKQRNS